MDSFETLADPTRRQIIEILGRGEKDAGAIADLFDVSQPAISRHLRVLREGGIVEVRADAQRRIYSLRRDGLREVDEWLSKYREFWRDRLDDLDRALTEECEDE